MGVFCKVEFGYVDVEMEVGIFVYWVILTFWIFFGFFGLVMMHFLNSLIIDIYRYCASRKNMSSFIYAHDLLMWYISLNTAPLHPTLYLNKNSIS